MPDLSHQLARKLARAATPAERRAVASEASRAHGCAVSTIYRLAREGGWKSNRKPRRDAGTSRAGWTADHSALVVGFVARGQRADGRVVPPVASVAKVLAANGQIPTVSSATVCRYLREHKVSKAQLDAPAVFISRRCEVGEVFQLDSSPALLWHLDEERGRFVQRTFKTQVAQHKPETMREEQFRRHLLRLFVTDSGSGMFYPHYAYATGETFLDTLDALLGAFQLLGVPRMILLDRGPGNTAWETRMLLWLLGVEVQYKGNSKNAMGRVEGLHSLVQMHLEWRWREAPPASVAAVNATAVAWWRDECFQAKRSTTGLSRWQSFQDLHAGILRVCPPPAALLRAIHSRPAQRDIDGEGIFRFDGQEFLVDGRCLRNLKQQWVAYDPWYPGSAVVLVGFDPNASDFSCEARVSARALKRDVLGFYSQAPRWGLGSGHPVGVQSPDHAVALKGARAEASRVKRAGGLDWYADLAGPSPILASAEAASVRSLVAGRSDAVQLAAPERPLDSDDAQRRAIALLWQTFRREPNASELAILRSWDARAEGVSLAEVQAMTDRSNQSNQSNESEAAHA